MVEQYQLKDILYRFKLIYVKLEINSFIFLYLIMFRFKYFNSMLSLNNKNIYK